MGKYLAINAGSSSLKFSLCEMPEGQEIISGIVERIGCDYSNLILKNEKGKKITKSIYNNHLEAVEAMLQALIENNYINNINEIEAVGHRVLHGGEYFADSVLIDEDVMEKLKSLVPLGPLHQPGQIKGIEAMQKYLPDVPQISVFDTAFHQTMPEKNYLYAVPNEWYTEDHVRRYGFHGTSYKYITEKMQEYYNKEDINLIICHVGNGASVACIKDGKCVNTSMGFTPLEGVIMGTRCGNIDPAIILYMMEKRNYTLEQINTILNKKSGLLGISNYSSDYRDLLNGVKENNMDCKLALEMHSDSVAKMISQYYVVDLKGKIDALVFTAGIGENNALFRELVINTISKALDIELDKNSNENIASFLKQKNGIISTIDSAFDVIVEPTNEEYMILKDTYNIVENLKENERKLVK